MSRCKRWRLQVHALSKAFGHITVVDVDTYSWKAGQIQAHFYISSPAFTHVESFDVV